MNPVDYLARLRDEERWVQREVHVPRITPKRMTGRKTAVLIALPTMAAFAVVLLITSSVGGAHLPVAAAVPWLNARPTTPLLLADNLSAGRFPTCESSNLTVTTTRGGQTMGDFRAGLKLQNKGDATCSLTDSDLGVVDPQGKTLVSTKVSNTDSGAIAVAPGVVVPFELALITTCSQSASPAATHMPVRLKIDDEYKDLQHLVSVPTSARLRCTNGYSGMSALTRQEDDSTTDNRQQPDLAVSIKAPQQVQAGALLHYVVSLHNATKKTIKFDQCPAYQEAFVADASSEALATRADVFLLNCGPERSIVAGQSARFSMQLAIPHSAAAGPGKLTWVLANGAPETVVVRVE